MTSREARSLLEQLEAAKGALPPYDTKAVQAVTDEVGRIADDLREGLEALQAAAAARAARKGASDASGDGDDDDDDDDDDGGALGGHGGGDDGSTALRVMRATIARNKRCLLAYVMHRADRVELLRWIGGPVLSPDSGAKLSSEEVDHFKREPRRMRRVRGTLVRACARSRASERACAAARLRAHPHPRTTGRAPGRARSHSLNPLSPRALLFPSASAAHTQATASCL